MPFLDKNGPEFAVHWELTHPDPWCIKSRSVKLDFTFDTADEINAIMEQVRIRVSPWQLLYRRMKEAKGDGKLSDKMLKDLFGCAENSTGTAEDYTSKIPFSFKDAL